jgi:uncharacterized iron-regulated membrane protein
MTHSALRKWFWIHKWTSLVSTAFLLVLCITGLPLIFSDEIDDWLSPHPPAIAHDGPSPSLDEIVATAVAAQPGSRPIFIAFSTDAPVVVIQTAPTLQTPPPGQTRQAFDLASGQPIVLAAPKSSGFLFWTVELHTALLLGLSGTLFLGLIALCLLAAILSGVMLYAPFMRKLPFGTVRKARSTRLKWLDLHNLLGIVTLLWLTVVGATGVINALHDPIAALVRARIIEMASSYKDAAPPTHLAPLDAAVAAARAAEPDMKPISLFFPGAPFATPHHFGIYLSGNTPVTSRTLTAVLVDAETGQVTDRPVMPWYAQALFISQPLHFGDYGGLPLKILWALLDLAAIVVLGSGLYLWLSRRKSPIEARLAEIETGGAA